MPWADRQISGVRKGDYMVDTSVNRQRKVVIADSDPIARYGVRSLLMHQPGWIVVDELADGTKVDDAIRQHPDAFIVDPTIFGPYQQQGVRQITARGIKTMILSDRRDPWMIRDLLRAGVLGYLLRSDAERRLPWALNQISAGRPVLSPEVAEVLVMQERGIPSGPGGTRELTPRERQVLPYLATGKSVRSIAEMLSISSKTVETHRSSILRKLGCTSLPDLVRYAIRHQIVQP